MACHSRPGSRLLALYVNNGDRNKSGYRSFTSTNYVRIAYTHEDYNARDAALDGL